MTQNTLQTVDRALSFLEYTATAADPPTIKEVSAALELNLTTCYHLLRTLVARNYIHRQPDGRLELGDGVRVLLKGYQHTNLVEKQLQELVPRLAASTCETAFLSLRSGDEVVLSVLAEGSRKLRVAGLHVGLRGNEHRRASGKAVLAHLDDAARTRILGRSLAGVSAIERKRTVAALQKELTQIVRRGWSTDDQTEEGIIGIGAPVFDAANSVVGAIGIVIPAFRMTKMRRELVDSVRAAATEGSRRLGDFGGS